MSFTAPGTGFGSIRSIQDLTIVRTLLYTEIGAVQLVKTKGQKPKFYALVVEKKSDLIEKKRVRRTVKEKALLCELRHPFVVKLFRTFNDSGFVYRMMEYLEGGTLTTFIRRNGALPNDAALFYAAEIALALNCLHEQLTACRSLSPDSICLSKHGHVRLTNFGNVRVFTNPEERSTTTLAITHYSAPEVLKGSPHGIEVDAWAYGVLLYEMLMGVPPFLDDDPQQLYAKILTNRVVLGRNISSEAGELIMGLLTARPERRMKIPDVMAHEWFDGVDFEMVLRKEIDAPWHPSPSSRSDSSNYPSKDAPQWDDSQSSPSELDSF